MLQSIKLATLAALTLGVGNFSWAQDGSSTGPAQTQTDPAAKPAGDPVTNTMVPYGVNPPVPDTSTPHATDTARPATTGEKVSVPQGNFTSESPNPAVPPSAETK